MNWAREKWRKVFCRPLGKRFSMSLVAACLHNELLKLCDDEGLIALEGMPPEQRIARTLGATRGDRRMIPRALEELVRLRVLELRNEQLVLTDFSSAQRKWRRGDPGYETWANEGFRKLFVRETGSFAQLSLFARGLAGELLRLCDDRGQIYFRASLADHLSTRLGHLERHHRWELLAGWLAELEADGYLGIAGNVATVRNFHRAQPGAEAEAAADAVAPLSTASPQPVEEAPPVRGLAPANSLPSAGEPTASHQPTDSESSAINQPTVGDKSAKSAESLDQRIADRSDPKRGDRDEPDRDSEESRTVAPGALALVLTPAQEAPARVGKRRRRRGGHEYSAEFEDCWSRYVRQDGKWEAAQRFEELAPEYGGRAQLAATIKAALAWQVRLTEWRRSGGIYVLHFATYLNKRRFLDQRPTDAASFADPATLEQPEGRRRLETGQAERARVAREREARARERAAAAAAPTPMAEVEKWALEWTGDPAQRNSALPPISPEYAKVWGEVIRRRLHEFKAQDMKRAELPRWALQWIESVRPSAEQPKQEVPPPEALPCDVGRLTATLADRLSQPKPEAVPAAAAPRRVARL